MKLRRWFSGLSKGGKAAVIAGVLLTTYAVLGFLIVPLVIRAQAVKYLEEKLQRRVVVEKVRLNPFALTASVTGLEISDRDGSDFLSWDEAFVNLQLSSILEGGPVFKQLRLTAPYIHLKVLEDGQVNVADIPEAFASEEPEEPEEDAEPTPFIAALMLIESGRFVFSDLTRPTPFRQEVGPVDLSLADFATLPDKSSVARFAAETADGEKFTWEGSLSVVPLKSSGKITIDNIRPRSGWRYFQDDVKFEITDGVLDFRVTYDASLEDGEPMLTLADSGLLLEDFELVASDADEPIIQIPRLAVDGVAVDYANEDVVVGSVELDGARLRGWIREDGRPHYSTLLAETVSEAAEGEAPEDVDASADGEARGDAQAPVEADAAAEADAAEDDAVEEEPAAPAEPWTWKVVSVKVSDLGLEFADKSVPAPAEFVVQPVTLTAGNISNTPGEAADFEVDLLMNGSGRVGAAGKAVLDPLEADVDLDLETIPLPAFQGYVASAAPLEISTGTVSAKTSISYRPDRKGVPMLTARGAISVDDLATRDTSADDDLLGWEQLAFTELAVDVEPMAVRIAEIKLVGTSANVVVREDGTTNLGAVAAGPDGASPPEADGEAGADAAASPEAGDADTATEAGESNDASNDAEAAGDVAATGAADGESSATEEAANTEATDTAATGGADDEVAADAAADTTSSGAAIPIVVERIVFENVALDVVDRSVDPAFDFALSELNGTVSGLSSDAGARADVDLDARLDRTGKLSIDGQINPLTDDAYTDLRIALANLDLKGFTPYTGRYVGRAVSGGRLSLELEYKVNENVLVGENGVEIDAFGFGRRVESEEATSLPVGLAIALLKDASGKIDFDLPVRGDLSDPEFSLGGIILEALANLITKVAASPFNLVGRLVPGGGENLDFVAFTAGADAVTDDEQKKITALADALEERPALGLEIFGAASRDRDVEGLQQRRLEQRLREMRFKDIEGKRNAPATAEEVVLDPDDRDDLLERLYRKTFDEKQKELLDLMPEPEPENKKKWLRAETERRLRETFEITDADLTALADARAASIRDALAAEGVAEERLIVVESVVEDQVEGPVQSDLVLIGL